MDITVLVEPLPNNGFGFRAISGEPLRLEAEAPTREEALQKLRKLIERRVAAGAEVIALAVETSSHPLAAFAGMLHDDPLAEPWKKAMAEYRDSRDVDADSP